MGELISNFAQEKVISTITGPLLVISCPGSGKTTTIIERTHNMIVNGIDPNKILVVTFTKEAATEMKNRYESKYGNDNVFFGTIHALCFQVLSSYCKYTRENILLETEKWKFFKKEIGRKVSAEDIDEFIKQLIQEISAVRNEEKDISKYMPEVCDHKQFVNLYEKYSDMKKRIGKIDFDDMIILTRDLFKKDNALLGLWQNRFSHLMVDEYQDTNKIQSEICYMLAEESKNICVVGDDDQSIYKFRGANFKNLFQFKKQFPTCQQVNMGTNYRSCPEIVEIASKLIVHNKLRFNKQFNASRTTKGLINYHSYKNGADEAAGLVNMLKMYKSKGIPYSEMAVIYRTNKENILPVGKLISENIPFYTTEPLKDIHNDFIFQDILAYWRLANGCEIEGDLIRILNHPSRYLKTEYFKNCRFEKSELIKVVKNNYEFKDQCRVLSQIDDLIYSIKILRGKSPTDFMKCLDSPIVGYTQWFNNFAEFVQKPVDEFLEIFAILKEEGEKFETMEEWFIFVKKYSQELLEKKKKKNKDGVCLTTMHSCKGLEWKAVFVINVNDGTTPFSKAETDEDLEEERRMFYVAITRAKDILNIIYISNPLMSGLNPSPYIAEMQ